MPCFVEIGFVVLEKEMKILNIYDDNDGYRTKFYLKADLSLNSTKPIGVIFVEKKKYFFAN